MDVTKNIRIMWLLNHTTARHFEITMLKTLGFKEIFLPKIIPKHVGFRSTSVDYSEDKNLTIPENDLKILNAENWHENPSRAAWNIANKYFDVLFFMLNRPEILKSISQNFKGIILWRAYGWQGSISYTQIMAQLGLSDRCIRSLGERFYFAQAYDHLHEIESDFLKNRNLFLPAGLKNCRLQDEWAGSEKKIFLVLPGITVCNYYRGLYNKFIADFKGYPYAVGGSQSLKSCDPNVLGFIPKEQHQYNMQHMRVMFYPGAEPNHVHYHPFEAVAAGMPLVFMAGGLLDRLGGANLPGRCKTIKEAQKKLKRILNDDWDLINSIRKSQSCLLEAMKEVNHLKFWHIGFKHVLTSLDKLQVSQPFAIKKKPRIAVLVTNYWRGGTLTTAQLLAQAITIGSHQAESGAEVVFGYPDAPDFYISEDFANLPESIQKRPFTWRILNQVEASRAMEYSGNNLSDNDIEIKNSKLFQVPDDGIKQFMDCDLWILVGDKLEHPLLPIKPYALMVSDYAERYLPPINLHVVSQSIKLARASLRVFVTTEFTKQDALQFAQLPDSMIVKLPMLINKFHEIFSRANSAQKRKYFLWPTNQGHNKNHKKALEALRLYYEENGGTLECHVTGVSNPLFLKTDNLLNHELLTQTLDKNPLFKKNLKILGELPLQKYKTELADCTFLWHATRIGNGSHAVAEAAHLGVPVLSSDYPAMREMVSSFGLKLAWMDPDDPKDMARQLKIMETKQTDLDDKFPSLKVLSNQTIDQVAYQYWGAIEECL